MSFSKKHPISLFLILNIYYYFNFTRATTFIIQNNCPYTIWAAATIPGGGGKQLNQGQAWTLNVDAAGALGIWGRTKCTFNGDGRGGKCESGDCEGLLECKAYGTPPITLAEFSLNSSNLDFFDISLANGFNVPMECSGCTTRVSCMNDINGPCPTELRDPGGCNSPCNVFQNNQFCCNSGNCGPTAYSRFFKNACPNALSYPLDDVTSSSCPSGTNFKVLFCP